MSAARMGWPTRLIALLIADARPALRTGTELISVAVRGATTSEIPTPIRRTEGTMPTSTEVGGISEPTSVRRASNGAGGGGMRQPTAVRPPPHGREVDEILANQR